MSVFTRLSDIINSNLNALLDEAEDPEKMLMLITREMEETLVEARSNTARYIADRKDIQQRIEHYRSDALNWEQKAELAVSKGRDDLAKAALLERKRAEGTIAQLTNDLAQVDTHLQKLQSDTQQLQVKHKEAQIRQQAILLRQDTAISRLKIKRHLHAEQVESALQKFEEYERRLDDLEGQVEAYDLGQTSLQAEIEALDQSAGLDAELASLKSRLASSTTQTGHQG